MSLDASFTETANQPIIIRHSKRKLLLMSLGSLIFVLAGLWIMSSSQSSKDLFVGLAAVIFSSLCLLVFLFLMFTSSLLLTIDNEGIHSFYPFWHPRTIKWEEIFSIYPIKIRSTTILNVTVSPTGKPTYTARNFKLGKVPFTLRKGDGPVTAISLSISITNLSSTQVIALIRERYIDQIRRYQIYVQDF